MSANFTPEKEDLKILTPFKMQVLTNFPYIEADFDALTNYQLLCKVVKYLNNVITEMNEVTEQTESLYNAFVSLQNYVNEYFDNTFPSLVNNKLDEMATDGTLQNLLDEIMKYKGLLVYPTVDDLKSTTNVEVGTTVKTMGYYSLNDGGGSLYTITDVESNSEYQEELENGLFATIVIDNYANVKQFGAYGDGEHDDTALIQKALDNYNNIYIPDGTYMINGTIDGFGHLTQGGIFPKSNTKILLSKNAKLKAITNDTGFYNIVHLLNVTNVTIEGGSIEGDNLTHEGATGEFGYGISIKESTNIIIKDMEIYNCWGDAIITHSADELTGTTDNIKILNCVLHDCRRQGISVVVGTNIYIENCEIYNISGTLPKSGIDIEANAGGSDIVNVNISHCNIHNTTGSSIIIATNQDKDITISDCKLEDISDYSNNNTAISNCKISEKVHLCRGCDKTLISNSFISQVDIESGNGQFDNCIFEFTSTSTTDGLIFVGNDYVQDNKLERVVFNNCKFNSNAYYFIFGPSPQKLANENMIEFINCNIVIGTNVNNVMNRAITKTHFIGCEFNVLKNIYSMFQLGYRGATAPSIEFILKDCIIRNDNNMDYLFTDNGINNPINIVIDACIINRYGTLYYCTNADTTGNLIMQNNVAKATSPTSISNNSVIVKTLANNNNIAI